MPHPPPSELVAQAFAALEADEARAVLAHVDGCASCARELAEAEAVVDALPVAFDDELAPAELGRRLLAHVLPPPLVHEEVAARASAVAGASAGAAAASLVAAEAASSGSPASGVPAAASAAGPAPETPEQSGTRVRNRVPAALVAALVLALAGDVILGGLAVVRGRSPSFETPATGTHPLGGLSGATSGAEGSAGGSSAGGRGAGTPGSPGAGAGAPRRHIAFVMQPAPRRPAPARPVPTAKPSPPATATPSPPPSPTPIPDRSAALEAAQLKGSLADAERRFVVMRSALAASERNAATLRVSLAGAQRDLSTQRSVDDARDRRRLVQMTELEVTIRQLRANRTVTLVTPAPASQASPAPRRTALSSSLTAWQNAILDGLASGHVYSGEVSVAGHPWRCTIVQPEQGGNAFVISRTPSAPAGHVYKTWVVRSGKVIDAGPALDPATDMTLQMAMTLHNGDVVAFTQEPSDGGDRPTQPFILEVKIAP